MWQGNVVPSSQLPKQRPDTFWQRSYWWARKRNTWPLRFFSAVRWYDVCMILYTSHIDIHRSEHEQGSYHHTAWKWVFPSANLVTPYMGLLCFSFFPLWQAFLALVLRDFSQTTSAHRHLGRQQASFSDFPCLTDSNFFVSQPFERMEIRKRRDQFLIYEKLSKIWNHFITLFALLVP